MCDPITASVVLGIGQAGMQIQGQRQAAKTQAKVQANASKAERERYLHEVASMRLQQGQEQVAAAQRLQASSKKAREARSTARVSAGESGVAGISVDALINDLTSTEANYNFATQQQLEMSDVNRTLQLRDAGLGFTNNMLRINKPIAQPNYLGAVLSGASTGLSAFSAMKGAGVGAKASTTTAGYNAGTTDLYKTPNFNQLYS